MKIVWGTSKRTSSSQPFTLQGSQKGFLPVSTLKLMLSTWTLTISGELRLTGEFFHPAISRFSGNELQGMSQTRLFF